MVKNTYKDAKVQKAASFLLTGAGLSVPAAMRAARFSDAQAGDRSLQQLVRRLYRKSLGPGGRAPPLLPPLVVTGSSSQTVASSVTGLSPVPSIPPPKALQIRKTSTGKQKDRSARKKSANHQRIAHKRATVVYAAERAKVNGQSARDVCGQIERDYGVKLSPRTITRYVKNGNVGTSPKKNGNPGTIPEFVFQTLCTAMETFMKINQVNGQNVENTRQKLHKRVCRVMGKENVVNCHLLNRVLKETAVDLLSKHTTNVEDRRVKWTTYNNLKSWFDNWEHDLEDLGFAVRNESGTLYIPEEQLARIINVDETCLSLDGSSGQRGGRPEAVFYCPGLPQTGRATGKSSLTTTMITGSTGLGEAIPPHFQFSTKAQSAETERLRTALITSIPSIRGKFGNTEERLWPVTIGMNAKGGMDDEEFDQYLLNSLEPLYPDVEDVKGKRALLKVDSGPGRLAVKLLARLRLTGWVLYPGVPNTTAVHQETDRNYGPFKTAFRIVLDSIVQERINQGKSTSINPWLVGLVCFGGLDEVTGKLVPKNAFQEAFCSCACLKAWAKIGAAPLTRACLSDTQVRRTIGDAQDETNQVMRELNRANAVATFTLTMRSYRGDLLSARCIEEEMARPITEAHSLERLELLAKASSHGAKFFATGGGHATTDDFFRAIEIPVWNAAIKVLVDRKADLALAEKIEQEGQAILRLEKPVSQLRDPELATLLLWFTKESKGAQGLKTAKLAKWSAIVAAGTPAPATDKWTLENEAELERLRRKDIKMGDTAYGRLLAQKKKELTAALGKSTKEERAEWRRRIDAMDASEEADDGEVGVA